MKKNKRQNENRKVCWLRQADLNNRKVFRLCRQTLMKGQRREIQIIDINLKAKIQDLKYDRRFSSANCTGSEDGGGLVVWVRTVSFLFYCSKAKRFNVWVCVSVLLPRIEPVGKPYREVCLQTKWWPLKVHQPNSWSKRPGTWIGHVLAYCRVGRKYVGCIELLFKLFRAICIFYHWPNFLLTVHFHRVSPCDLDLCTHKCIQLNNKLFSINWPNMRKIRWKMAEKSQNADSGKEIKK